LGRRRISQEMELCAVAPVGEVCRPVPGRLRPARPHHDGRGEHRRRVPPAHQDGRGPFHGPGDDRRPARLRADLPGRRRRPGPPCLVHDPTRRGHRAGPRPRPEEGRVRAPAEAVVLVLRQDPGRVDPHAPDQRRQPPGRDHQLGPCRHDLGSQPHGRHHHRHARPRLASGPHHPGRRPAPWPGRVCTSRARCSSGTGR